MRNHLELGKWNVLCDRCGLKFKNTDLRDEWTGLKVCKDCWESRHPQTLIQVPKDDPSVPWARPDAVGYYTYTMTDAASYVFSALGNSGVADSSVALVPTTANTTHFMGKLNVIPNGATNYSYTARFKPSGYGYVAFQLSTKRVDFNLNNGTYGYNTLGGSDSATILSAGDGWYDCTVFLAAPDTASSKNVVFYVVNSDGSGLSLAGDGTSGILFYTPTTATYHDGDTFINVPYISSSIGHQT